MSRHNFTLRLTTEEHEWLKQEAEKQQRSVGNFILYVLNLYKKNQTRKDFLNHATK